jgi:hypothetical protein
MAFALTNLNNTMRKDPGTKRCPQAFSVVNSYGMP